MAFCLCGSFLAYRITTQWNIVVPSQLNLCARQLIAAVWGDDITGAPVFLFPSLCRHRQILSVNSTGSRMTLRHHIVKYRREVLFFTTPITRQWRQTDKDETWRDEQAGGRQLANKHPMHVQNRHATITHQPLKLLSCHNIIIICWKTHQIIFITSNSTREHH